MKTIPMFPMTRTLADGEVLDVSKHNCKPTYAAAPPSARERLLVGDDIWREDAIPG